MFRNIIITVIFIFNYCVMCVKNISLPEDVTANFTEMAQKFGKTVEEYDITTSDMYILKLFHIPGDRSKPLLLMHGFIDSADCFIIRKEKSLIKYLSEERYDIWVGNVRGNRYSRKHTIWNPDADKQYWDFSFHEIGIYDLPALIDFVLFATGNEKLSAIGHSQGNSLFYIMGSLRPEYNDKIKILVALAPIAFLNNINLPLATMAAVSPLLNEFYSIFNEEEILGENTLLRHIVLRSCLPKVMHDICKESFMILGGSDPEELETEMIPTVVGHYPTSTSKKNGLHLSQVWRRQRFSQYDYGDDNLVKYKALSPPDYDLNKVTMKVAIFCSASDNLSTVKDVEILRQRLPNVVETINPKHNLYNHVDYIWGKNIQRYLMPDLIEVLEKYDERSTLYTN